MNLENIFFLTKESKVEFPKIVRKVAGMITDYTINAKLSMFQIDVALNDKQGLIDGEFHTGGCQFVFQEYHEGNPIKFKLTFEGEEKRFKIELETNSSNPDGFISYFVEPHCTSILHKKIKEFLSICSKPISIDVKEVDSNIENQVESTELLVEEKPESVKEEKEITEESIVSETQEVETIKDQELPKFNLAHHKNDNCACPNNDDLYEMSQASEISEVTSRVRKLFFVQNDGEVGIFKCEHCGKHLLFEKSDQYYIKVLENKTVQYFLDMKPQLEIVIADKGVSILRSLIIAK